MPSPSGDTAASPRSCRLLLVLRCLILRQAPTCLTTMIAADFCRITTGIPSRRAMPLSRSLPLRSLAAGNPPQRLGLGIPVRPRWIYGSVSHRYVRQISPGKNAMFRCTSAAFTVGAVPVGFAVMCQLASAPSAFYAVSPPQGGTEVSVASHVCTPASSRQCLTTLPLPSASGYHCSNMSNQCRYSHRGLTPHYIAPMLGAHPSFQGTLRDEAAQRP